MNKLLTIIRTLSASAALAWATAAWSGPLVFTAQVEGLSNIVGVVDPTGPIVSIETEASGLGSLGPLRYVSADEVNLGTGLGAGHNRFIAEDGSELFGIFIVQLVPTADPAFLELLGEVDFIGGTGRFAGADGFALFTGAGRFISASTALSSFDFVGEVTLVSEPGPLALTLAGLGLLLLKQTPRVRASARDVGAAG